jgi:23S rRNA U2552 (ribose-2'-O)-methylase RlmE/FtsJ
MDFNVDIKSVSLTKDEFIQAQNTLKEKINAIRSQIDELRVKGLGMTFTSATRFVNPYEDLSFQGSSSRAFFKLYEILKRYRLLEKHVLLGHSIKTLHLCEAPGSFVEATQEYIKRNWGDQCPLDWYGVTLRDGLKWKTTNQSSPNVIYADVTKDTLPDCVKQSVLVTGDGGFEIDFKDRNDQEVKNTPLLAGQIHQSFQTLAPNGHMVIKMFDMMELDTCELLWDCYLHFDKLYIIKPFGSRICNSEKYVVGVRYNPKYQGVRAGINNIIPAWFYGRIWTINLNFVTTQIKALTQSITLTLTAPGVLKSPPRESLSKKQTYTQNCLRWLGLHE